MAYHGEPHIDTRTWEYLLMSWSPRFSSALGVGALELLSLHVVQDPSRMLEPERARRSVFDKHSHQVSPRQELRELKVVGVPVREFGESPSVSDEGSGVKLRR